MLLTWIVEPELITPPDWFTTLPVGMMILPVITPEFSILPPELTVIEPLIVPVLFMIPNCRWWH